VDTHTKTGLGEAERRGAARDATADDRDVDTAVVPRVRASWDGVFEPVRVQDVER
jgi:hypothetical protein